jgi:hypothetical protein
MGPRTRGPRFFATAALLLILIAVLDGCERAQDGGALPPHLTLVSADGQRLDATVTALTEQPAIPEATAKARAAQALTDSGKATAVQAHFVALTLGTETTPRHVWLITYNGVPFATSGCTCHVDSATANSIVAIDVQTGVATMIFGVDGG